MPGLIVAASGLALASTPEAFLVLWASDRGWPSLSTPDLGRRKRAVKVVVTGPAGTPSDRFGRVPVLLTG